MARTVIELEGLTVVLVDSITELLPEDAGRFAVSGSHGGVNCAGYALAHPIIGVAYNDAGVGKAGAGIAALPILEAHGVAGVTVSHVSAVIGEARETYAHGMISHANGVAMKCGLTPGLLLRHAFQALTNTARIPPHVS